MEETKNSNDVYYKGLKLRRMEQYKNLKFGDFERGYDANREYTKQSN